MGNPAAMGSMERGWPMTPVEATTTSSAKMPSASAVSAQVFCAISTPLALQVLALPLLQMMALALPSATCLRVTVMGAPNTLFCV